MRYLAPEQLDLFPGTPAVTAVHRGRDHDAILAYRATCAGRGLVIVGGQSRDGTHDLRVRPVWDTADHYIEIKVVSSKGKGGEFITLMSESQVQAAERLGSRYRIVFATQREDRTWTFTELSGLEIFRHLGKPMRKYPIRGHVRMQGHALRMRPDVRVLSFALAL